VRRSKAQLGEPPPVESGKQKNAGGRGLRGTLTGFGSLWLPPIPPMRSTWDRELLV